MANTLIDYIQPAGIGGENSVALDQTAPVASAEEGRAPQIAGGVEAPGLSSVADSPGFRLGGAVGLETLDALSAPVGNPPSSALPDQDGFVVPGYEGALYDRIHVIPSLVALGNVLEETVLTVEVWNAHPQVKTLAQILATDPSGISVQSPTPPGAPPSGFPGFSSFVYSVLVPVEGATTIDAVFAFDFSFESPQVNITGTRTVAFLFEPQVPITEALEWSTEVLEAYAGDEQRIRARNLPRQLFEMDYLITRPNAASAMRNSLVGHHGRLFAVPVWPFGRPLLQDTSIGDTTILVDTDNADFRESTASEQRLVVLFRDFDDFEIAQVAVGGLSTPGQISLERELQRAHSGGTTEVIPMQIMLAKDPIEWSRTGNGVVTARVSWLSEEYDDLAAPDGDLTLFDGAPVLTGFNFITDSLEERITDKYELFDSVTGAFRPMKRRTIPEFGSQRGFETEEAEDSFTLRRLLYALRGKQRAFWSPTWAQDFEVVSPIGSSDTSIAVADAGHGRFVDGASPFSALMILLKDGSQIFRKITGIADGAPGEEVVSLDSQVGQNIALEDLQLVSYLVLSRFGSDRLTLTHPRKAALRVRAPILGVKQ